MRSWEYIASLPARSFGKEYFRDNSSAGMLDF